MISAGLYIEFDQERFPVFRKLMFTALLFVGLSVTAGEPTGEFKIAEKGQALVRIYIAKDAVPTVRFAAEELAKFLKEISGAEFKIVIESDGKMPLIVLGDNKLSRAAGIDVKKLIRDGSIIRQDGHRLYIAGVDGKNDIFKIFQDMAGRGNIFHPWEKSNQMT